MDAVVLGNVTLDVICKTVDEVPRFESLSFEQATISPGGCGSNTAIGLCALGVNTSLVARTGDDGAADMLASAWDRFGLETSQVRRVRGITTGVSIGLVDSTAQPRFIHTSGANARLTAEAVDLDGLAARGARLLHVAGFFVLPGLLDERLALLLDRAQRMGIVTSMDVVRSPRMQHPEYLWPNMPYLDLFQCNAVEAEKLTGNFLPEEAARRLRERGARAVVVKLGERGCYLDSPQFCGEIPVEPVQVVDTTGAGDSFAAGLIAGLLRGETLTEACGSANQAGALAVGSLGAIGHWQLRVQR